MNGIRPSNSTLASAAIGAPIAIFVAWLLEISAGIKMPAEVCAALGAIVSAIVGYFAQGGRHADVTTPAPPAP